jgi:hypothetical protein
LFSLVIAIDVQFVANSAVVVIDFAVIIIVVNI